MAVRIHKEKYDTASTENELPSAIHSGHREIQMKHSREIQGSEKV
jgi:hypothetical protein